MTTASRDWQTWGGDEFDELAAATPHLTELLSLHDAAESRRAAWAVTYQDPLAAAVAAADLRFVGAPDGPGTLRDHLAQLAAAPVADPLGWLTRFVALSGVADDLLDAGNDHGGDPGLAYELGEILTAVSDPDMIDTLVDTVCGARRRSVADDYRDAVHRVTAAVRNADRGPDTSAVVAKACRQLGATIVVDRLVDTFPTIRHTDPAFVELVAVTATAPEMWLLGEALNARWLRHSAHFDEPLQWRPIGSHDTALLTALICDRSDDGPFSPNSGPNPLSGESALLALNAVLTVLSASTSVPVTELVPVWWLGVDDLLDAARALHSDTTASFVAVLGGLGCDGQWNLPRRQAAISRERVDWDEVLDLIGRVERIPGGLEVLVGLASSWDGPFTELVDAVTATLRSPV